MLSMLLRNMRAHDHIQYLKARLTRAARVKLPHSPK